MALRDIFRRRPEEEEPLIRQPDGLTSSPQGEDYAGEDLGTVGVGAFERPSAAGLMINESLATPVIGRDEVIEAGHILAEYMAGKSALDRRLIEADRWWRQRHWDVIREEGTTTLQTKSGWLVNVVLSKHADAMDALPEPNVLPRAEDDKKEAMMLSKIVPVVLEEADWNEAWKDGWWSKLQGGTACYGVFWDKSKHNGLGDVGIRAVDLLKLYWQPGVANIQDSRNLFAVELVDNELLEEQYPELEGELGGRDIAVREYYHDDHVDTSKMSPVVDWYYKKQAGGKTVLHLVKFVGDHVLYATENDPKRTDTGLYNHGMYPFFPDVLFPIKGSPAGFGYIDLCKDAQRQIDLMNNAIVANTIACATPRWFKRGDGGVNEEEFADWTRPFVHVTGSMDETGLRQIQINPMPGNLIGVLDGKIAELKEITGNRDVNNGGAPSGVTAASAIAAMQEQSGKLSRDQIRVSYDVFKDVVSCVIELIRQFYDAPRQFRITGQAGQEEFVFYDNKGLNPPPFIDPSTGTQTDSKPVFDLKVTAQKATEYTKMAQNELAIQLYQLGFFAPQNADPSLSCLEMMDFDGREDVIRRVQQNGTRLQLLQMAQAENMMLKAQLAKLGITAATAGGAMENGGGGQAAPATDKPARLPESDNQGGGVAAQNRIADKAKAKAQAATQPG